MEYWLVFVERRWLTPSLLPEQSYRGLLTDTLKRHVQAIRPEVQSHVAHPCFGHALEHGCRIPVSNLYPQCKPQHNSGCTVHGLGSVSGWKQRLSSSRSVQQSSTNLTTIASAFSLQSGALAKKTRVSSFSLQLNTAALLQSRACVRCN